MRADLGAPGATLLTLIDGVDLSTPENLAVSDGPDELTYFDLSVRARHLAAVLREVGVKPGDLVGLCLPRSRGLVIGALATFRADAAYLAIDPHYPCDRIRWMLDDSAAVALICDSSLAPSLGTSGRPTVVIGPGGEVENRTSVPVSDAPAVGDAGPVRDRRPTGPEATDLAYVVYTSGSTGRPKGVMIEHGSLANLVDWHRRTFGLRPEDRCSQIASPGFDAAIWEIWPSLVSGASLHVVPDDLRSDPVGLRDWLVSEKITVSFLPTALAEGLIGLAWPDHSSLRFLLTGGDALTRRPRPGLGFTVVNNYGLSETTVVATSGTVRPGDDGVPSIGRPITGIETEVVDENLDPVGPGDIGELLIGGIAVGRGYINRPDLTAERFLEGKSGRRYRTGDRVRLLPDGEFAFLGRTDDQLSIRGFRVEPAEITTALCDHPAIGASVVIGVDGGIAAYLVASRPERPSDRELSEFLSRILPDHFLPSRYLWLDELPLTAHGKIDRDALPAVAGAVLGGQTTRGTTTGTEPRPRTPTETAIAAVLAELLEVPDVGMHENFFLLGGHSMLGAQLIVRLEKLFDVEITLRYLFDHPTLAGITAEVEKQMAGEAAGSSLVG